MDIRKLQRAIVDGLEDVKAQDIVVFNTEHLSPLFERVIIATGSSNRQTKALASGVREAVKAAGFPVLATEGGEVQIMGENLGTAAAAEAGALRITFDGVAAVGVSVTQDHKKVRCFAPAGAGSMGVSTSRVASALSATVAL